MIMTTMTILFVCSGNAFRSPVAEALLKKYKPELGVVSAGTNPVISISESAREYLMTEDAAGCLKLVPEGLDEKDLAEYGRIIAMESRHRDAVLRKCPGCSDKTVVWDVEDPYFLPPGSAENIFEEIKQKVKELADSI